MDTSSTPKFNSRRGFAIHLSTPKDVFAVQTQEAAFKHLVVPMFHSCTHEPKDQDINSSSKAKRPPASPKRPIRNAVGTRHREFVPCTTIELYMLEEIKTAHELMVATMSAMEGSRNLARCGLIHSDISNNTVRFIRTPALTDPLVLPLPPSPSHSSTSTASPSDPPIAKDAPKDEGTSTMRAAVDDSALSQSHSEVPVEARTKKATQEEDTNDKSNKSNANEGLEPNVEDLLSKIRVLGKNAGIKGYLLDVEQYPWTVHVLGY